MKILNIENMSRFQGGDCQVGSSLAAAGSWIVMGAAILGTGPIGLAITVGFVVTNFTAVYNCLGRK